MPNTLTSIDVICEIVARNSEISALKFVTYMSGDLAAADELEGPTYTRLRRKKDQEASLVPRARLNRASLAQLCHVLHPHHRMAVASSVRTTENEKKFIPMLDFACSKTEGHLRLIVSVIAELNHELGYGGFGFVLESTKSYHYFGCSLLPAESYSTFLGLALLLHPPVHLHSLANNTGLFSVIDARTIGHCLLNGESAIRISSDQEGRTATVVARIGPH
jgi:hypothetical protein